VVIDVNLLIIESNADERESYRRSLQSISNGTYHTTMAGDGSSGLQALESARFDCVLLEYTLPGMGGLEVLRKIRAGYPSLPVIVLAGSGNAAVAVDAIRCGASDYLPKSAATKECLYNAISSAIALNIERSKTAELKSLSVLVVDQNQDERKAYIRSLETAPDTIYRIVELSDGRATLDRLGRDPFDCVLLDDSLPGLGALDILEKIHIHQPFLPVILLAALDSEILAVKAIKDGASNYLVKSSLNAAQLHTAIVEAADHSDLLRDIAKKNATIKEMTESLALIEERYDLTVLGMSIGVWDWNIATNETYWSDKLKDMLGIRDKTFEPRFNDFVDRLHPDDEEATMRMIDAHLEHLGHFNAEFRLQHSSGKYVWVQAYGQAQWDEEGEPVRMAGSIVDISRRKKAEERRDEAELALKASEETFRLALEDASIGMALVSTTGRLLKVNRALCDLLGYKEYELLANDFQSVTHPDDLEQDQQYLRKALAGEIKAYQMEKRYVRKSGRIVWALLSVSLVRFSNGEPNYFISQIQDITERKEMERMKSDFVSMVSHELRTPLTSIRGSLSLLAGVMIDDLPEKANRLVDIAYKNSERLILLINDILDMDKIASGQMRFDIKEEAIHALIRQAVVTNQPYADKFSVTIIELPVDERIKVNVDPGRLLQVLANLLSNAAKFSNQGDNVEIGTVQIGETVRITVQDHGMGIPEEFRARIFGKFSQADSSGTRAKGGTGLGLHISRQMVKQMGGEIGFDSEVGKGTAFWVDFPIVSELEPDKLATQIAS
jgi:PAS domain S-box-containing protein